MQLFLKKKKGTKRCAQLESLFLLTGRDPNRWDQDTLFSAQQWQAVLQKCRDETSLPAKYDLLANKDYT